MFYDNVYTLVTKFWYWQQRTATEGITLRIEFGGEGSVSIARDLCR